LLTSLRIERKVRMEFFTAHYLQQGATETALVLQHLVYPKDGRTMVFACVCKGKEMQGGERFIGLLQEWFRREGRELLRRDVGVLLEQSERQFRRAFTELERQWRTYSEKQGRGNDATKLCGIFCVDERFLLFCRGGQGIYLLNTRFERPSCKKLVTREEGKAIYTECGWLEPGVGILLATESFCECLTEQQLCECLSARELSDGKRMQKRLKELGEEGVRQGAKHQGAVLIATNGTLNKYYGNHR